ncbi:hypothetical protein H5410_027286 [Solanum commersonii]|uniref:Uncharacterized protein n=1 Tax=Solanum commersonii TaxID=4109 RepID=A0A9J5YZG5_SOLCO|nr:hypothetical protein H5410_027286 [Solanum commersonii]
MIPASDINVEGKWLPEVVFCDKAEGKWEMVLESQQCESQSEMVPASEFVTKGNGSDKC